MVTTMEISRFRQSGALSTRSMVESLVLHAILLALLVLLGASVLLNSGAPRTKKEIEDKINTLLAAERDFAENSPMPPPEFAETGVYCTGDDCHKIRPKWERPLDELVPPKSGVEPLWTVEGFGRGKTSSRENAPIHFGDTQPALEECAPAAKTSTKLASKSALRKPASAKARARGKARR